MQQISLTRRRLEDAGDVAGILAAAWRAFDLAGAAADAAADMDAGLHAAFTFAGGAAVDGRNALALAPSLPGGAAELTESRPRVTCGAPQLADILADLASGLGARLREAAGRADDDADRAACSAAAARADQIRELLARA